MVRENFLFVPSPPSSHITHPITLSSSSSLFTSQYPSAFDLSSLVSGPELYPFLISSLLFYSFFHFLSILPDPHCLFRLSHGSFCRIFTDCSTPSSFYPICSFLWTLQLCSAFRRHGYLQFCMFENLWWARDSHHCSTVYVCLCEHDLHDGVCARMRGFLPLWMCLCARISMCA